VIEVKFQKTKIILLLFTFSFFVNSCNKTVYNLKIGDVYIVSLDDQSFTTWKITKIETSKIWYIVNDYNVSEKYLTDSINFKENYTDLPKSISREAFTKKQQIFLIETPKK